MQLSMMIADVGFMLNVSGSRIATPLAPPRPGSTPISTPSVMPISMKPRLGSVAATAKPWNRFCSSSTVTSEAEQCLERTLGQRHQEPAFEHEEEDQRHADGDRGGEHDRVPAVAQHEEGDQERRGDVDAQPGNQHDVDGHRPQDG